MLPRSGTDLGECLPASWCCVGIVCERNVSFKALIRRETRKFPLAVSSAASYRLELTIVILSPSEDVWGLMLNL